MQNSLTRWTIIREYRSASSATSALCIVLRAARMLISRTPHSRVATPPTSFLCDYLSDLPDAG
jgi:hypothetical protein